MGNIKISIVIVNYNVKEYLAHALSSLQKALEGFSHEIIVVDNNSVDGSVSLLRSKFPQVIIIENKENLGFGRANNQALQLVNGEFVVLINPDTLVQEDTFRKLLEFFNQHPQAGAATCKIINPDGTFAIDCRHSIPTPSIALWKVLGLSRLFPHSKIFGQYNLTYLAENQTSQVPAISGSFMMVRREVFERVGYFDERFFMYCEDIDLCQRINEEGYQIFYVPSTQIVHYKGESTKKDRLDYVVTFNKSLYQFFQKYYAPQSVFLFRWLIAFGILLRGSGIYLKNFFVNHFPLLLDTLLLNIFIIVSFVIRLELGRGFFWQDFFTEFWVINALATLIFWGISFYLEIYPYHRFSIQSILKANIITFLFLAALTFFFKQFAFSRAVTLLTFIFSPLAMISWRAILRKYHRGDRSGFGRDLFSKPTVVIGSGRDVRSLFNKMVSYKSIDYDLKGWISLEELSESEDFLNPRNLGVMKDLNEIIKIYKIRQIIFSANSLSYEQIMQMMSGIKSSLVEFKMVPSNLDVVIGKSHIDKLDDYPLLDINYSLGRKFNRLLKRSLDIIVSGLFLTLTAPLALIFYVISIKQLSFKTIPTGVGNSVKIPIFKNSKKPLLITGWTMLLSVLRGKLTLVGAPLDYFSSTSTLQKYFYQPGLTGLVQINQKNIASPEDTEKYHLFYLKNQSLLLDLEIMFKAIWQSLKTRS